MNVQNVKQKLDKVNSFYAYLIENQEIVSRVDRAAFLASIRSLYDACFDEASTQQPAQTQPATPKENAPSTNPLQKSEPPAPKEQPETPKKRPTLVFNHQNASKNTEKKEEQLAPQPKQQTPPPVEQPPVKETSKPVEQKPVEPQQSKETPKEEKKQVVSPSTEPVDPLQLVKDQHEALNDDGFQEAYEPLFRYKAATDISQKLSASKLDDLQKALGLNEKFLYINELFGGDVGQFQSAIKTLNEGENFEAARHYIEQNLIAQNEWMSKNKRPVAKDFIKLVRRRYA